MQKSQARVAVLPQPRNRSILRPPALEQLSAYAAPGRALLSCRESYRVNPLLGTGSVPPLRRGADGVIAFIADDRGD